MKKMSMEQFLQFCGMPCCADGHCPYKSSGDEGNICSEMCGVKIDDDCKGGETENWDVIESWLTLADEFDFAENEGREVMCVNMCGGKYQKRDENGCVCGLTDSVDDAIMFLKGE